MPLYSYECPSCGTETERICPVKDHRPRIKCECGRMAVQVLGFAHVIPDIQPYKSMVTGERIRGRAHHKQHIRDHGLIEVGNERLPPRKPKPMPDLVPDLKRAIEETRRR
jgi:putative FmdB family regulatory protein